MKWFGRKNVAVDHDGKGIALDGDLLSFYNSDRGMGYVFARVDLRQRHGEIEFANVADE
jgi:hypothetical protein